MNATSADLLAATLAADHPKIAALAAILVAEGRASWSDSPMTAEQGPFIIREQGFDFEKLNTDLQDIFKKFTR